MTDPDERAEEVHAAVAIRGAAGGDPDDLVAQIESTREDLARTIDALAERVSPAAGTRLLREKLTEQLGKPRVQATAVAAGAVLIGLVVLRTWARRRRS